jgi:hypothetical protein
LLSPYRGWLDAALGEAVLPIDLDQFTLWTATFEVRYDTAFLLWDHVGSVWAEVKKQYPETAVEQASPNQVRVAVDDRTQGVVSVDRAFFTVSKPKSDLRELQSLADVFFPVLFERIDISTLTRIGLRVIYGKEFTGRRAAADFLATQVPLPNLKGKYLNVEGSIFDPETYFVYEGEALAFSIRVKAQEMNIKLTVPVEFEDLLSAAKGRRSTATVDIDYFAHGATPVASFSAAALIEGWLHLIRRDIRKVF